MKQSGMLLLMAVMTLVITMACAVIPQGKQAEESMAAEQKKIPFVMGTHYTTLTFNKGESSLSKKDKKLLESLDKKARKFKKPINEIRILAWSDKEYPGPENRHSYYDIQLASERAKEIKSYLEEELKETEDIDSYNMARRPDFVSKLLRDDEYIVKEAFEQSGTTASKLPDGSTSFTKTSKALVIIDYEK